MVRFLFCTALLASMPLGAQPGTVVPPDDPRLYQAFLDFHHEFSNMIRSRKATRSTDGAKLERGLARKVRVKPEEFEKVTAIAEEFVKQRTNWQEELKAYVADARSRNEERCAAALREFDQRRTQLIDNAVERLKTTLSPESWAGLHAYINDEHRLHVRVFEFKPAPAANP